MEEYKHPAHQHPLLLLNEEEISKPSHQNAECWMCGEKVSAGPCFGCQDCPEFYLHKLCAKAPSQINHPFHLHHPLELLQTSPYTSRTYICNFCWKSGTSFVYHCSCDMDFHIKCALFTLDVAEQNLKEHEHVSEQLEEFPKCLVCWEPLAKYPYLSLDCGFNLHQKCVDLPLSINHMSHPKHPLLLQFDYEELPCRICHRHLSNSKGIVYGCSLCKFFIDIECSSLPPVIVDKSHQHSFTLFRRRVPFFCDACGKEGNFVGYICNACSILVHKRCISLPRMIRSKWHHGHLIFHNYFLEEDDFKTWDCIICHEKVNLDLGSYSCSHCKIIFHVNCVMKDEKSYFLVENEDEEFGESSITRVIQSNNIGEAIEIKHFKHEHNLLLSDKIEDDDKSCDGCVLPISDSYYYCREGCDICLHKACAELPKSMLLWYHDCRQPLILTSGYMFCCRKCRFWSKAFAYECKECLDKICLRCVIALTPGVVTCSKHEHPLYYYTDYEGQCVACRDGTYGAFRCKDSQCHFALDHECFSQPTTARHKCDEHLLALTYHDDNPYPESQFCDICEERRDPNVWFYHCATCETCAHVNCVLGKYPFFKLGDSWGITRYHPHPLILVKKMYYYPDCSKCSKPCQDWALKCNAPGCNYITHFTDC